MKKRILIFHQNMVMGGVEKVTLNLLENLDRDKYDIKFILIEKDGELLKKIPKDITVEYLLEKNYSKNKSGVLKYIGYIQEVFFINKKVKKIIKFGDIILNMNMRNIRINIAILKFKNKKIGWIHGNILNDSKGIIKKINYKLFKQYNKILNVSNEGKKDFDIKFPKLKKKSDVLYNSFNIKKIQRLGNEKFEKEKEYLISVGRLEYEKGFDLLINAINLLKLDGINEKLYILGEGKEKENLIALIKKLKLENNIYLLGFKSNPYEWLKNAKLLILTSRGEGLPTVLIEGLICGKAIVSTDCKCGPKEILKEGEYGFLVKNENINSIKDGIKTLIENKKLKNLYEEKASKRARDFSNEKVFKKLEKIIYEL